MDNRQITSPVPVGGREYEFVVYSRRRNIIRERGGLQCAAEAGVYEVCRCQSASGPRCDVMTPLAWLAKISVQLKYILQCYAICLSQ